MRHLMILTWVTSGLLCLGGPAASEDKPPAKKDKPFEGAVGKIREAAARSRSANNLKQLGLAFHIYADKNAAFPPAATYDKGGKALLSWRVAILPFIEEKKLYDEFKLDEAWDSAHNKKLLAKMPKLFADPSGMAKANHTFYQVFVGKGAAFEGKKGLKITDFTDGTSNTILVVEGGVDVPWTKPADLDYQPGKKLPAVGGIFPKGFNAGIADGSVRFFPKTLKAKTLEAYITRNGGEVVGKDD
jgi:hypothetical protein